MKDTPMPTQLPPTTALDEVSAPPTDTRQMAVSALVDGEADDLAWADAWDSDAQDGGAHATWHRYHLIGDVLRAGGQNGAWSGSQDSLDTASAVAFARRVTHAAQQQGMLTVVEPPATQPDPSVPAPMHTAANDGIFRWKMVAGLASFTAVLGIAWGVAGGAGQGGAILAQSPARSSAAEMVVADGAPVLVSTPQGQVLRDARLQELMQTHRQSGGASALQAPAGFLRTSALDAGHR